MPKRKPFHNRLEELFVQTSPEQPGPWEALLTRVEPEEDGWLVGPESPLPEPNVLLVQPVPGAAGAEARREASVSGLAVRPAVASRVAAARSPGARPKKRPAARAAPRSRAVLQAAPVDPELGPEANPSPRVGPPGWKDFLAAVRQAEQVNTGARFIEAPSPRSGPPAWKNFLAAIGQAEQVEPAAGFIAAPPSQAEPVEPGAGFIAAPPSQAEPGSPFEENPPQRAGSPGWNDFLTAVRQAEPVEPETRFIAAPPSQAEPVEPEIRFIKAPASQAEPGSPFEEKPPQQAGSPGWKSFIASVGQAEQIEPETRFIEAPVSQPEPGTPFEENAPRRAGSPGWKDTLTAVRQAEQVEPGAGFIAAPPSQAEPGTPFEENPPRRSASPGRKDTLTAVRQAEQVEPETLSIAAPSPRSGTPGWKNVLQSVQQAEQVQPDFSIEERLPGWVNEPRPAARPVLVTEKGPVLSAALLAGEQRLGSIELEAAPDRPWSEQEAGLLNSVAQQMVLHLENLRLLEQAEQYRQEAEQVVRRMTRAGWEDFLLEKEPSCTGFVYDHGQVISLQPGEAPGAVFPPASRLAHPIKVREETIGQLVIESPGESGLTGLIDTVAERLGLQVESLRLLEETERARQQLDRRAAELETVAQVSTAAAALLNPQALLQAVVDLTQSRFKLYHAQIYLLDEQAGWLILAAGSGEVGAAAAASKQMLPLHSNAAVAQAARKRRGVIIPDIRLQAGYEHYPLLPDTLSELAVPMIAGEQVAGAFSVLADVTDRFYPDDLRTFTTLASQAAVALCNAELYAEQMETVDRLRELDQLKSAFLANMSHELRTPLNSILGFAQVITEGLDGPLTEDMVNDLNLIEKNGRHLLNLINDVLDMAKIEAGRLSLDFETFDLGELVQDVLETAGPLARNRSLDLQLEVDLMANLNLRADRFRIRQILLNLVGNAIKFTEEGGVTVRATQQGKVVRLGIQDTGIGIPPEKLEAIFEAFSQVDTSTTRKAGGTGLGLPISRRLVEMHGGRLWAESSGVAGEGTLFWLELPIEGTQKDD